MNKLLLPSMNQGLSNHSTYFEFSCNLINGTKLTAVVKQIKDNDYEVFIKEKGVIIHCRRGKNGTVCWKLNTYKNPSWIDAVGKEVARRINGAY